MLGAIYGPFSQAGLTLFRPALPLRDSAELPLVRGKFDQGRAVPMRARPSSVRGFRLVFHLYQIQPVRRGNGSAARAVAGVQRIVQILRGPFALPHQLQRTRKRAHLMMQE